MSSQQPHNEADNVKDRFLTLVNQASQACKQDDYHLASQLYTKAIQLDKSNHTLYSNRSASYLRCGEYYLALQDANQTLKLQPGWPKGFFRKAVAEQMLGQYPDSLQSFVDGLVLDPHNSQLLNGLKTTSLQCPLKEKLQVIWQHLERIEVDTNSFIVISVIGQELLSAGLTSNAIKLLESAVEIGTESLRLRGSVYSALSTAYWRLGETVKAIQFMKEDLQIAKQLEDINSECRAVGNLGNAMFAKHCHEDALAHHREQLRLAMRRKDRGSAAAALSSLGHVYSALGDMSNALASHEQCLAIVRQLKDRTKEAQELGSIGSVYLSMGELNNALEYHQKHLELSLELGDRQEEARVYSNLGSLHHSKRNFAQAEQYHEKVVNIGKELNDRTLQARGLAGLGHTNRLAGNLKQARLYHERQLQLATEANDITCICRAYSNLGVVLYLLCEHQQALELHEKHLHAAERIEDAVEQCLAYGNMGNVYYSLGNYDEAVRYHQQALLTSKNIGDRMAECSTHGNLAIVYQAMRQIEKAESHYRLHLSMAQELNDDSNELRALNNLGNFYCYLHDYRQAISYYEGYKSLCIELGDVRGEETAYHCLGYVHYCLNNYQGAIQYFRKNLTATQQSRNMNSIGRAYCNLGCAYKLAGNYQEALSCLTEYISIASSLKSATSLFNAYGHVGEVYLAMGKKESAIEFFNRQLKFAKLIKNKSMEANAYHSLGKSFRLFGLFNDALDCHTNELRIYEELEDRRGIIYAHGQMGLTNSALGQYEKAIEYHEVQLTLATNLLKDRRIEGLAHGRIGINKRRLGHLDDALHHHLKQLSIIDGLRGNIIHKCRAYGDLGETYEALKRYRGAIDCYEKVLAIAQETDRKQEQERAYSGTGNCHKALGNLQQALICYEKRAMVCQGLPNVTKCLAYKELGQMHSQMGNYEQALDNFREQNNLASAMNDKQGVCDAINGIGQVYQKMGDFQNSLYHHQKSLANCKEINYHFGQLRAFGDIGNVYESLGNFEQAMAYQQQRLDLAEAIQSASPVCKALSSLARIHHSLGDYGKSTEYSEKALKIALEINSFEDQAKIYHRLGLSLWMLGEVTQAESSLQQALTMFDSLRTDMMARENYQFSILDLQIACSQALQRVLISSNKYEEALVIAEKARTQTFIDIMLRRQDNGANSARHNSRVTVDLETIYRCVDNRGSTVLYYSIALGHLYVWVIKPQEGLVKFQECLIDDTEATNPIDPESSIGSISMTSTLPVVDQYISNMRQALGVESHQRSRASSIHSLVAIHSSSASEWDSDGEMLGRSFEDLSRSLDNYLSSTEDESRPYALGVNRRGSNSSINGQRTRRRGHLNRQPVRALYDLLVSPIEKALPLNLSNNEVLLIPHGDLYLVPFNLLRGKSNKEYLYSRFTITVLPSLMAINDLNPNHNDSLIISPDNVSALLVGGAAIPNYCGLPRGNDEEIKCVASILNRRPLVGRMATKEYVLRNLASAECIHFNVHVSWKLSAIILSSDELNVTADDESEYSDSSDTVPAPMQFLLTPVDILSLKLSAKVVTISPYANALGASGGRITSDSMLALSRAFLEAGASTVLVSLWPVPDNASILFFRCFYQSLTHGRPVNQSLVQAMSIVRHTKKLSHPSYWAGYLLLGNATNVIFSSKPSLLAHSLGKILAKPREGKRSLKVILHLINKAHTRISIGETSNLYAFQDSIGNKVMWIEGWKEILLSVGFRFEPENRHLPASVFFPNEDFCGRLPLSSDCLHALLELKSQCLMSISQILKCPGYVAPLLNVINECISNNGSELSNSTKFTLSSRSWQTPGCHELLVALGFDMLGINKESVVLSSRNIRNMRFIFSVQKALSLLFDHGNNNGIRSRSNSTQTVILSNTIDSMEAISV